MKSALCVVCNRPLKVGHKCPQSVLELYEKAEQIAEDQTMVVGPGLLGRLRKYRLISSDELDYRMDLLMQRERGY